MKCAVHAETEATGFCRNCGKALCPQCTREVKDALYCEDCLAKMLAPSTRAPGAPNPGTAAALGVIPGLGAVYNGEYMKALIHVLIFGGLIAIMSSDSVGSGLQAMAIVLFVAFLCYMPIEAHQTAKARNLGQKAQPIWGSGAARRPMGAYILIVIGVLLLLNSFGFLNGAWVGRLWPLILIAIGVWLIWRRARSEGGA